MTTLSEIARAADVSIDGTVQMPKAAARAVLAGGAEVAIPLEGLIDFAQERGRLLKEKEKLQKVVFLKDGSKAKLVKVTTGIADDANVEIKSGVQPGDEVISGSYSAISRKLKNDAKVMMEKGEKK